MTQLDERVKHLFESSIATKIAIADQLSNQIIAAGERLVQCLLNEGKILLCGNGGSAANCLHFSAAMMSHFEIERPPLPVIALTCDLALLTASANNGYYDQIFANQINALGQKNDLLIVLSTSGNANNILQAISAANDKGMDIIALTGRDGGILTNHIGPEDQELRVQADNNARIREIHLFILHCFCDLIEQSLFGGQ